MHVWTALFKKIDSPVLHKTLICLNLSYKEVNICKKLTALYLLISYVYNSVIFPKFKASLFFNLLQVRV